MKSQSVISSEEKWGGCRKPHRVFTEAAAEDVLEIDEEDQCDFLMRILGKSGLQRDEIEQFRL